MQILSLSRYQQKTRLEEMLSGLTHEVQDLKETCQAQGNLLRRQRAELAAMASEAMALRKVNQNQRMEIKYGR